MRDYFKFNLTGKKLLPIWLLFLVLFMVPYVFLSVKVQAIPSGEHLLIIVYNCAILLLLLVEYAILFFIVKISIENTEFRNSTFAFKGKFGQFMGILILGGFFTIITLGIYSPWFIKKMQQFFVGNSSFDSTPFEFLGKGGKLLVIFLLTLILPMIFFFAAIGVALAGNQQLFLNPSSGSVFSSFIMIIAVVVLLIPYMYYFYKWMVDVKYKNYLIRWETSFWKSCGKIALEILFSVITIGIYYPLAMLRLYQYFVERTVAVSAERTKKFGYDIASKDDFLFIWGQLLLTIVTLGIYYPWAYSKVIGRILGKTYLVEFSTIE